MDRKEDLNIGIVLRNVTLVIKLPSNNEQVLETLYVQNVILQF